MRVSDVTTQFPDKVAIQALIDELKAYADSIATGDIDLSDYVTKSELQVKLDALDINIDLSSYATKEELTNAINSIDLSAYALKTEIPSLDGYATKTYVDNAVSNVPSTDLTDYYTKEETDNLINNIPSGGGTVDLSNYYTKDETYSKEETDALIPTVTNGVDGVSPTVTVTKEGKVATITCTDVNGTTTATISDGADGSSSGGGSSGGGGEVYSTEETAIGTWIDGRTIYRKVISMDLPAVKSGNYFGQQTVVASPCGISLLDWRAISYAGLTGTSNDFPSKIIHGDGFKSAVVWTTKTSISALTQELCRDMLSVFHVGNPTSSYINCYYGSSFASKRCDFIIDYLKIETT